MKAYTDITVLLDRSGSMSSIRKAMQDAFNEFVNGHKSVPSTKLTLIQFDSDNSQDVVYQSCPIGSVEPLHMVPRGMTPLLDATCQAIDNTGKRFASLPESERPDQVLMVIITDGAENCSSRYKRSDVYNRVTAQRNHYNWQFVYLGANQDVFAEVISLGISPDWALSYTASVPGTAASVGALMSNTVSYSNRSRSTVEKFSPDQRTKAADNTSDPNSTYVPDNNIITTTKTTRSPKS